VAGYRVTCTVLPYVISSSNKSDYARQHTECACRVELRNQSETQAGKPSYSPSSMALQSNADLHLLTGPLPVSSVHSNTRGIATVDLRTTTTTTQQGIKSRFSRNEPLLLTNVRSQILHIGRQWRSWVLCPPDREL
jgi:hypothetical protein